MPAPSLRRQQNANLLLLQNLLSCHPGTSPFTLVQDTLEQPGRFLLRRFVKNAKASKSAIIFISYEMTPPPSDNTSFIKARRKSPETLRVEITKATKERLNSKILLIIDTVHPLASLPAPFSLPSYLSSLLSLSPSLSLVAVYHLDVPLPSNPKASPSAYVPTPLTLLRYLATTILTIQSLSQSFAKKKARDRSLPEPLFGMEEEMEGVLVGLKDRSVDRDGGMVLEMEHRRKSGRVGGGGMFYVPSPESTEKPITLEEHPLFRVQRDDDIGEDEGKGEGTFELRLTEKQRKDRERVVLPYFDAQKGEGEGGRILYDMGVEDDFDEEEDEI